MDRKECVGDVIARYIGVETQTERIKLRVLLDLYADAVLLDEEDRRKAATIPTGKSRSTEEIMRQEAAPEEETEEPAQETPAGGLEGFVQHPAKNGRSGEAGRAAVAKYAEEKRQIHDRLTRYREKNGMGCFAELVKVANGALTDDDIRNMLGCKRLPIAKWKILSAALDALEE